MKLLFITLLLSIGTIAMAQSSSLKTRISDDEKILSIQIDGYQNGRKIHFAQRFDVSDMTVLRKEMLKYRVFTSLGVSPPLHEIPWTIFTVFGAVMTVFTLLVFRLRPVKSARRRSMMGLRIE